MKNNIFYKGIILTLSLFPVFYCQPGVTAEKITFVNGLFNRTVSVKSLEYLAQTGTADQSLKGIMRLSNQDPKDISNLLKEEIELPLVVTSKLMYSTIGEVIIHRVAKIIHPPITQEPHVTIPAIRSAVIDGIVKGNGKINLIQFLKSYPNKIIAIDIPALLKVTDKVDSMSELVKFFSESPLERMKEGGSKT